MAVAFGGVRSLASTASRAKATVEKFRGILSASNRIDNYSFAVSRRGRFSASLTRLKANAALQLRAKGKLGSAIS